MAGSKENLKLVSSTSEEVIEKSDDVLVYSCANGELEALGTLFSRYNAMVYRFFARMAGTDTKDLDDLVQTTFIEVQKGAPRFRGRSSVKNWIMGIATNVARHHIRSEVRRKNMLSVYNELPRPVKATPQDSVERKQLINRLSEAIQKLSHKLKVVFVLCDLEGVPGVEVARILGIREGTVWRRLHEARKKLRTELEGGS